MATDDASMPRAELTVERYLERWLRSQATQLRPRTWDAYRRSIRRYVLPTLADVVVGQLHVRDLNRLYAHLFARGGKGGRPLSRTSVEGVHRLLHKAFEDGINNGELTKNPTRRAKLPKVDHDDANQRERAVWTIPELWAFLEHTREHRLREFWVLAAFTGLRLGELSGLRWDDIDWDQRVLRVRRSLSVYRGRVTLNEPKSGRGRSLHIDDYTVEALRREQLRQERWRTDAGPVWHSPWNLVFTNATGRHFAPTTVSEKFRRAVRAAPVPHIRFHDLRHFHATVMLQAGVPVKVVSARLGHASAQTTLDVYAHVLPAMDADAVHRFTQHIAEADGPDWSS